MVAEAGTIEIIDIERSGLSPLDDARGAATIVTGGTRLFATSSETQNQISVFSVDPVSGFSFVDGAALDGAYGLTFAKVDGATILIGAGRANDTLNTYTVSASGILTPADSVTDLGARNLDDQQGAPAVIEVAGTTYVVQAGYVDDGLSVFRLDSNGDLTSTFNLDDSDAPIEIDFALDGPQAVTAFRAHGQAYVAAAGNLSDGIGLFRLSAGGQLAYADSMFDSDPDASGLETPLAMAHATIGGRTFLFTASDGTNAIASVEVQAGGTLEHQGNFLGSGTTGENLDLSVVQTGGLTFLLSTDRGFGTITAFLVDNAGRLQRIAQRTDTADPGSAHDGAFGVTGFAQDQRLFALVAAQGEDAITMFEIGALDDTIAEGSDDDILIGFGGNDTLSGLGGNDSLHGMAGADRLLGGNDNDRLFGGNGNDQLRGEGGIDRLEGGRGLDRLFGGGQADALFGQAGNDILRGGLGADRLGGGNGNDKLFGENGKDVIRGGAGEDTLGGGKGADRLFGGDGSDTLIGAKGADVLFGGGGVDRLNGDLGNDILVGGAGADRFQFFSFRDGERDVIRDFQDGIDMIDINRDVSYFPEQQGNHLLITFEDSGHEILFRNFSINQLDDDDFI